MRVLCVDVNELDVKREYKDKLKTIIAEYTPSNKVSTNVKTVIVLNDERLVTSKPRRLDPWGKRF